MKAIFLFLFLILVSFVIAVWHFGYFSQFDSKSKFSIVTQNKIGDIEIKILDPVSSTIANITISKDTQVQAANKLGIWKLGSIKKLGNDKNLGPDFLKYTIIKSFGFPIDASYESLSLIDKLKIKYFMATTQTTDVDFKNKLLIQSYFDENPGNDNINVTINNQTGEVSSGKMAGQVIENIGANIASLQSKDVSDFNCKVIGINNIAKKISKIFSCELKTEKPANNFDIQIDLGQEFAKRF